MAAWHQKDGGGGEANRGALRGASSPVLGAIDGGEALAVPGVVAGAGVEEEYGEVWVPKVGGQVEGRAALAVGVANRVRVGNERGSGGGEGRVADGAVKDALAAGVGD